MAYNKSKHIDAAQKFLHQGKLPQAISEYQLILKHEPKDQVALMTLGDLFVRKGETFQALEYFERLATLFLSEGFTAKAIAIYKKVGKLAPEETRPLERLAELYVQQGVMSEARPLFLQLAEVHLRAGRQAQAAALFRKLLDAEPDNLRVQTRLGELQVAMGQSKEALQTFLHIVARVLERGDHAEAVRMADRALQIDAAHPELLLLKARAWTATGKPAEAAGLLESSTESTAGGEITTLLLENYLSAGQHEKAVALAENTFAQNPKQFAGMHHVAIALIDAGNAEQAQSLLARIHDAMIDAGEQETLAQILIRLAQALPGEVVPLERLAALYAKISDSFRLVDVLAQLARIQETNGNDQQALETYERLLDRAPENEAVRTRYDALREKMGLEPVAPDHWGPVKVEQGQSEAQQPSLDAPADPVLDAATERYVRQALIDVDLLSSYGLNDKSIDLLETALKRAPRHAPVLERLLDLSVATGEDEKTANLADQLRQLALERNDTVAAERYSEIGRRYHRAAGHPPGQPGTPSWGGAAEFAVPIIEAELADANVEAPPALAPPHAEKPVDAPAAGESAVHEVDLSEEWAALSRQLEEAMQAGPPMAEAGTFGQEQTAEVAEATGQQDEVTFDLEPQEVGRTPDNPLTGDGLISELTGDLEAAMPGLGTHATQGSTSMPAEPPASAVPAQAHGPESGAGFSAANEPTAQGPLGDLFEQFRSDLGEMGTEGEDPETHYSLGVAYREMGLLEEAISEFQKVAQASERGNTFGHAMQCCTLLGLAFMEKGQPLIAAMWYERALLTPGLDQEAILALRYDLGVAQELGGEATAAYRSFSQVYAMNIDYRDVAERVAALGKAR